MAERGRRGEPSDEELAYQRQVLDEVDAELAAQGGDVIQQIGARIFRSYSRGPDRKGFPRIRRDARIVVLVPDGYKDNGDRAFAEPNLAQIGDPLDQVAHDTLTAVPESDRFYVAHEAIKERILRIQNQR